MTESEWLASKNPREVLDYLGDAKLHPRKLRLFVCACTRQVWGMLLDEPSRQAVEVGERFADRLADRAELEEASSALRHAPNYTTSFSLRRAAWTAARCVSPFTANSATKSVAESVTRTVALAAGNAVAHNAADAAQADLVRDVFGNPFRPVAFDARFRTPQVLDLAQAAYDERPSDDGCLDPLRLMVLADFLEEEGCPPFAFVESTEEYCDAFMHGCEEFDAMDTCTHKAKKVVRVKTPSPILTHLRSPGPHVRGCWALDLILGRE